MKQLAAPRLRSRNVVIGGLERMCSPILCNVKQKSSTTRNRVRNVAECDVDVVGDFADTEVSSKLLNIHVFSCCEYLLRNTRL